MAHVSDIRIGGTSILDRIANLRGALATRFDQYRTFRRTLGELESLTKRELYDLGLNEHTLRAVAHEAAYGKA